MILRRLGQKGVNLCEGGHHCPQIIELVDGDFVGVGMDITGEVLAALPAGPGVGPKERAVRIPRHVMIAARSEIPMA